MNSQITKNEYTVLLKDIKQRIHDAQYQALKAVNKELIRLYWDIGKMIVDRQKGKTWGKAIVDSLSKDLRSEFPGMGGFSPSNLWRMKLFSKLMVNIQKSHHWCEKLDGAITSS